MWLLPSFWVYYCLEWCDVTLSWLPAVLWECLWMSCVCPVISAPPQPVPSVSVLLRPLLNALPCSSLAIVYYTQVRLHICFPDASDLCLQPPNRSPLECSRSSLNSACLKQDFFTICFSCIDPVVVDWRYHAVKDLYPETYFASS